MANAVRVYFRPRRQEVNQGRLVVELYDGALNYLKQARDKLVASKYAERNQLINRAVAIIAELARSLDMQSGGDLAVKLNNLYLLCSSRLLTMNERLSVEDLESVVAILTRLRRIYAQFPEVRSSPCVVTGLAQNGE
ncbi:MAG: flagellar protein FliS [Desulfovibrionaceae bacterium]|nr:flagellar protein FliS [Desulfovibrionaceae bacterium]